MRGGGDDFLDSLGIWSSALNFQCSSGWFGSNWVLGRGYCIGGIDFENLFSNFRDCGRFQKE